MLPAFPGKINELVLSSETQSGSREQSARSPPHAPRGTNREQKVVGEQSLCRTSAGAAPQGTGASVPCAQVVGPFSPMVGGIVVQAHSSVPKEGMSRVPGSGGVGRKLSGQGRLCLAFCVTQRRPLYDIHRESPFIV